MESGRSLGWSDVDAAGDTGAFVDYLDRVTPQDRAQAYKKRTYDLVGAAPGRRILDLGCGTGEDAIAMARRVDPGGEVVGIDRSQAMVQESRRRALGLGLPVRFEVADGLSLPFADRSFDGCRADRLFQHLDDPEGVLAEMIRAARPGAPVVVADPDYGSAMVDLSDRTLARKVKAFLCDQLANPWSGRRLVGMFRSAGLVEVRAWVEFWPVDLQDLNTGFHLPEALAAMQAQGLVTAGEAEGLLDELATRAAEGRFFAGSAFFVVAGRKAS